MKLSVDLKKTCGKRGAPRSTALWHCPSCGESVPGNERYRYPESGLLAKHCGCKTRINKILTPEQLEARRRERSIEYKRKARREAGSMLRKDITERAAAKRREKNANKLHDAHVLKFWSQLHDEHVKRYKFCIKARQAALNKYKTNTEREKSRCKLNNQKRKQLLKDSYVVELLVKNGVKKESINKNLINLKRELMSYKRLSRIVKTTVKQYMEKENESITKHS